MKQSWHRWFRLQALFALCNFHFQTCGLEVLRQKASQERNDTQHQATIFFIQPPDGFDRARRNLNQLYKGMKYEVGASQKNYIVAGGSADPKLKHNLRKFSICVTLSQAGWPGVKQGS